MAGKQLSGVPKSCFWSHYPTGADSSRRVVLVIVTARPVSDGETQRVHTKSSPSRVSVIKPSIRFTPTTPCH